jgi:NADH:ubiquinone oxidoreductase subunit 5 (subunit L)/multisubunit Na+/H+ antiporter MnhA subunit
VPLMVLAVLSFFGGNIGVQNMLRNSMRETEIAANNNQVFRTAWQAPLPGEFRSGPETEGAAETGTHASGTGAAGASRPLSLHEAHEKGHHLVQRWVMPAFVVGIALGVVMYLPGYKYADRFVRIKPLAWVHTWLYRRMYFDEMYQWVFVNVTMALSEASDMFDRNVVDRLVNWTALGVRRTSDAAGMHDRSVIDGAVNGVATVAHDLGAAVRNHSGRVRMYVTVLMIAVALGLAAAIFAVLS